MEPLLPSVSGLKNGNTMKRTVRVSMSFCCSLVGTKKRVSMSFKHKVMGNAGTCAFPWSLWFWIGHTCQCVFSIFGCYVRKHMRVSDPCPSQLRQTPVLRSCVFCVFCHVAAEKELPLSTEELSQTRIKINHKTTSTTLWNFCNFVLSNLTGMT